MLEYFETLTAGYLETHNEFTTIVTLQTLLMTHLYEPNSLNIKQSKQIQEKKVRYVADIKSQLNP